MARNVVTDGSIQSWQLIAKTVIAQPANIEAIHQFIKLSMKWNLNAECGAQDLWDFILKEQQELFTALENDIERVKMLLNRGYSTNAMDSGGYTALHYAARNGHYHVCELLLENGAAVNAVTRCAQATPLHKAASQGHIRVVELLLSAGANANLKDDEGYTALHRAITADSIPVCRILLACTDLNLTDKRGRSPKELANQICIGVGTIFSDNNETDE